MHSYESSCAFATQAGVQFDSAVVNVSNMDEIRKSRILNSAVDYLLLVFFVYYFKFTFGVQPQLIPCVRAFKKPPKAILTFLRHEIRHVC